MFERPIATPSAIHMGGHTLLEHPIQVIEMPLCCKKAVPEPIFSLAYASGIVDCTRCNGFHSGAGSYVGLSEVGRTPMG